MGLHYAYNARSTIGVYYYPIAGKTAMSGIWEYRQHLTLSQLYIKQGEKIKRSAE